MTRIAIMRDLVAAFCDLFLLQGLTACETTEGFGRDLQGLGQNIGDKALE